MGEPAPAPGWGRELQRVESACPGGLCPGQGRQQWGMCPVCPLTGGLGGVRNRKAKSQDSGQLEPAATCHLSTTHHGPPPSWVWSAAGTTYPGGGHRAGSGQGNGSQGWRVKEQGALSTPFPSLPAEMRGHHLLEQKDLLEKGQLAWR